MKLSSKLAIGAAMALGLTTTFGSVSAGAQTPPDASVRASTSHRVASVGSLHASAAKHVDLRSLPNDGKNAKGSSHRTLLRSGKPTGSNLPSRPSTGRKAATAAASTTPLVIANGFDGIGLASSSCNCQPPDVNATVGPNNIVEAVNLSLAVYTKTGTGLKNTALATFLGTTDGLSDPRVLYDPTWNRWSLVLTDTSSPSLWFAYSTGANPAGSWYIYHVGFPFAAGSIVDYPMVGMDQDAFIYTSNNFSSTAYLNSTALTVPKARVYNGFGWSAALPAVNYNTTPAIVGGHPIQQSRTTYLLSPDDANNVMKVYYFTNTAQGAALTFKGNIAYTWAAPARRVNQPGTGTTLDPLDGRIDWAVSQLDGKLWFAHGADFAGFPTVNWGYVNPGAMTIAVNTAYASNTSDDFNPSIAAMDLSSGGTQEVLSWAFTDSANGVPTTTAYSVHAGLTPAHLGASTFSTGGGITNETRFGDYSSVAPEYNANGTCVEGTYALVANQYFATNGTWKTRIARVHPAC